MTDWGRIQREKDIRRASSAALPFEEKLRILATLRERDRTFKEFRDRANANTVASVLVSSPLSQTPSGPLSVIASFGANEVLALMAGAAPAQGPRNKPLKGKAIEPDR